MSSPRTKTIRGRYGRALAAAMIAASLSAASATAVGAGGTDNQPAHAVADADWAPTGLDGKTRAVPAPGARATLLIFILHDCPVCNRYAPEITRIATEYADQRVATYAVYEESDLTAEQARQHANAFRLSCGLLTDPTHRLARHVGASAAPEAVLLSPESRVVYDGRIDDTFRHFGMAAPQPTTHDLRAALDAFLAGKEIKAARTRVVGCAIPHD